MPKLKTNPKIVFLYASCQTAVSSSLGGIAYMRARFPTLSIIYFHTLVTHILLTHHCASLFPHELSNVSIYFLFNKQKYQQ